MVILEAKQETDNGNKEHTDDESLYKSCFIFDQKKNSYEKIDGGLKHTGQKNQHIGIRDFGQRNTGKIGYKDEAIDNNDAHGNFKFYGW